MSLQSEHINELMSALSKAQGEMHHASKDSVNPHFKSKYADLAAIWTACREPLSKNGLAVTQTMDLAGESQILVTTLAHGSGQWIKSIMKIPVQKPGAQEIGSCLSYCRRYSLASMVGVYQDDDDGEASIKALREPPKPATQNYVTKEQLEILEKWTKEYPDSLPWIYEKFGIKSIRDVPTNMHEYLIGVFLKRAAKEDKE